MCMNRVSEPGSRFRFNSNRGMIAARGSGGSLKRPGSMLMLWLIYAHVPLVVLSQELLKLSFTMTFAEVFSNSRGEEVEWRGFGSVKVYVQTDF